MPQLASGRHVGLNLEPLLDGLRFGEDYRVFGNIYIYRRQVHQPADLLPLATVLYYREGEGNPPDAPAYSSGFTVQKVLDGEAGWSEAEIAEFRTFLEGDARVKAWLATYFDEINQIIFNSPALEPDAWDDPPPDKVAH